MSKPVSFVAFVLDVLRLRISEAQRVLCAVSFDDVQPASLSAEHRALAAQMFGDTDSIPEEARAVVAWLKGARVGGTWLSSLYLLYRGLTADLSGLAAGEMAFAPIVAPDMKTGRVALRYASGAARSHASIGKLVESDAAESLVLRRHDGRYVSIETLAASRGGSSLRGRSMVAALMDESSFFRDADSGVVNDVELYRAIAPRVLAGGKLCVISTAWMRAGLLWELVQRNHGHARTAVAAIAPTLLMRPDASHIRRVIDEERARDADNAAREFDCVPFDGAATAFIDPSAIDAMVDPAMGIEEQRA